uniref:Uncharacterized protein n=1 Tax=Eutreptiella gymnastica TaxID=73025 RepID=A0A7S1J1N1_9EUGL
MDSLGPKCTSHPNSKSDPNLNPNLNPSPNPNFKLLDRAHAVRKADRKQQLMAKVATRLEEKEAGLAEWVQRMQCRQDAEMLAEEHRLLQREQELHAQMQSLVLALETEIAEGHCSDD